MTAASDWAREKARAEALAQAASRVDSDAVALARDCFLNVIADAKRWDSETDLNQADQPETTHTIVTNDRQMRELVEALGIECRFAEATEDAIERAMSLPETKAGEVNHLLEALGAHVQGDGYADAIPDNDEDAKYLRRQETWWRLTAKQWAGEALVDLAAQAAKARAIKEKA